MRYLILIVLLLTACGDNTTELVLPEQGPIDMSKSAGFTAEKPAALPTFGIPAEIVESQWRQLQLCAGTDYKPMDGWLFRYVDVDRLPEGKGGFFLPSAKNVTVGYYDLFTGYKITRHELIHYLLYIRDGEELLDGNREHTDPLWEKCDRL